MPIGQKSKQILVLVRKWQKAAYTIGVLSLDGVRLCNMLEPPCNGCHHGVTAIPKGTYEIDMTIVSPKYKERVWSKPYGGIVPTLMDVPGRDRILIHPGNTINDTDGCLLPGENREVGKVLDSQICYHKLMNILLENQKNGIKTFIRII
ncbi:MAG: hypothetical protein IKW84_08860 [Bacteroidaceae bacterium]|nr:hypothetical protein [Bacteroidaceae bacterium]MBR5159672.1 hypothetical protein [Bacteroidaceae bacterium]